MAIESGNQVAPAKKPDPIGEKLNGMLAGGQVTDKDRLFFTEQLALLLSTGTNLHASLQTLKKQVDKPAMRRLIEQLSDDVAEGRQFSTALARYPEVFSQTYVNLIGASEDGGFMHEVLEQILDMERKREKLHDTLVSAMSYPAFLLVFALGVVIFVLVFVFPKFSDLFISIQDELPATTVFLMGASDMFRHQWPALVSGLLLAMLGIRYWARSDAGSQRVDWLLLHVPPFRGIFTRLYLTQSLRVLSLSLGNGVAIIEALHAGRDVVSNRLYHRLFGKVEKGINNGEGIAVGFADSRFIPPIVHQMIQTGEETGSLPKVMGKVADHYERELSNRLETLSRLAEPVLLLIMGVLVGVIVSSLILPIFKLSRAVG